jgi:hypothetical protein
MPGAPLRVRSHETERVTLRSFHPARRNGDDRVQKRPAMTLRLLREFLIYRIPIFRAFPLQQFERALPDFGAALVEALDDAGRQRIFTEAIAPLPNLGVGGGLRYPLCKSTIFPSNDCG